MTPLICPNCKVQLIKETKTLRCPRCRFECIFDKGVYDFLARKGQYYWGEVSPEDMNILIENAYAKGWRTAVRDIVFKNPSLNTYILSNARIDWLFHCIDFSRTGACLDLGSGWGTMAFALGEYYDEVWSLEAIKQRIEFQTIRSAQDEVRNIKFIRSDWLHLPFHDNYFDLVVANGVLEWVGLSDVSRNPQELQAQFLLETKRILKPGGCLYIGIENRFGLTALLGENDHSGLPFTSLLPRKVADLAVRKFRKTGGRYEQDKRMEKEWQKYHTYTYSYWGYQKLLRKAGFEEIEIYWTPSYVKPMYAGRFDADSCPWLLKHLSEQKQNMKTFASALLTVSSHLPHWLVRAMLPLVTPCFLIFAYKERKTATFESQLLQSEKEVSSFLRMSESQSSRAKVNYFLLRGTEISSVLKFPRFRDAVPQLQEEEHRMTRFNQLPVERKSIGGAIVFRESRLGGRPCKCYSLADNIGTLRWLLAFQDATKKGVWRYEELSERIEAQKVFLSGLRIDEDLKLRNELRLELLLRTLREVKLDKVSEHGDFWPGNIMIGGNHVNVLDWEDYQDEGEPFFDFVCFILACSLSNSDAEFHKNFSNKGKYSAVLRTMISEFSNQKNLPDRLIWQTIPYVILRCIHRAMAADNQHVDNLFLYLRMMKLWDEACFRPLSLASINTEVLTP